MTDYRRLADAINEVMKQYDTSIENKTINKSEWNYSHGYINGLNDAKKIVREILVEKVKGQ